MATETRVVLWIDRWASTCGACGRGADPREPAHTTQLGYGEHPPEGCGATFEAVGAIYADGHEDKTVKAMRPDLPYVGVGFGFPQGKALPR